MTVVFLASFIGGLLLAVRAMLFGVERPIPFGSTPQSEPRLRTWAPVLAAFGIAFGVVGYLATRPGRLELVPGTLLAALAGVLGAFAAVRLVKRAAAFVPEHDPDDPRYVLQGHVATVLRPIAGDEAGEIAYVVEGTRHVVPACGIDGAAAAVGSEVVIERLDESGTAWVEPWATVEERL